MAGLGRRLLPPKKKRDPAQDSGPYTVHPDASICFPLSQPSQTVPILLHERRAKLLAAAAVEPDGAEESALRSTVAFLQRERCFMDFPLAGSGNSRHLLHRDVGLEMSVHVTTCSIGRSYSLQTCQNSVSSSKVWLLKPPYTLR